ncbi:hypothetical protein CCACVL1_21522 [Corchorus capsularis]|uniref:Uncharacterized protein n=1 Tax=Corchorus capsularis TaxID=210143 RepID=A0A1R3H560_COCAP|nr:hypothetical protein CCACVL1_21522 [Corchorus capsularis]
MALQPTSSSHKQSSINPLPLPLPSSQPNMLDPGSKFPISDVDFSDQTGRRLSAADGYDSHSYNNLHHIHHGVLNYESRVQKTAQNYANYRGFGAQASMVEDEDDESGDSTPPLWRSSPSRSPPSPHRQYRCLSPSSKAQAIARGQKELMEMVSRMPESCYELSLKDLVEHQYQHQPVNVVESRQESFAHGTNEESINKVKKKKKKQNNQKKPQINRSGSMDNGGFLLKMVFPISLGSKKTKKKKKNESNTNQSVKISPKPTLADSSGNNKTTVDKEWWKKRSESSESESGGSTMNSGSTRSSRSSSTSSSSSCRSITNTTTRTRNGKNGCLDFILSRRSKASR